MGKNYAPKQHSKDGKSIQVGDIDVYYEEYGSGESLVLLHGFGGCVQNW